MGLQGRLEAEQEAYIALGQYLAAAQSVVDKFARAELPIPDPLRRLLGDTAEEGERSRPKMSISAPTPPPRPSAAGRDSIWVAIGDATPTSIVLGLLRIADRPISPSEMVDMTRKYKPSVNQGTVYNLGKRLRGHQIENSVEGWKLKSKDDAPMIHDGFLWGTPDVFQSYDIAAFRRTVVRHVLEAAAPDGLMAMQIVRFMQNFRNPRVKTDKTLIKVDLDILQREGRAKQISNSRKWTASDRKEHPQ